MTTPPPRPRRRPPRSSKAARSCSARRWSSSPCSAGSGSARRWLHRRRRADRAADARPDQRPGAARQRDRDRHRAAAVHRRAGASAEPACGGCARTFSGSAWRRSCCAALALSALLYLALGISPEAALAIGLPLGLSSTAQVLPMLRSRQRAQHAAGRARLLDPAVPGPVDRPDDHDHRGDGAGRRPIPSAPAGLDAGALHGRSRSSAWCWSGGCVLNPLFRLVGRLGERELFVVAGLFTVVGAAAVMHALHCRSRSARSSPA